MSYKLLTLHTIKRLGIYKKYDGVEYILSCICYIQKHESNFMPVSKILYVDVAKYYNKSYYSVEREIRTVIKMIWNNEDNRELRGKIFGLYNVDNRIGNAEFLSLLYNYIKYNYNYEKLLFEEDTFKCPISGDKCEFCKELVIEAISKICY